MPVNLRAKVQVLSGLQEDLPLLDTGQMGFSIDTQKLWIGSGSYADGAPIVENIEILTQANLNNIIGVYTGNGNAIIVQTNTLTDNISIPINTGVSTSANSSPIGTWEYNLTRSNSTRIGTFEFAVLNDITVDWTDSYSGSSLGVSLSANISAGVVNLLYTTTGTGSNAVLVSTLSSNP